MLLHLMLLRPMHEADALSPKAEALSAVALAEVDQ